jgi:hypothetical protein
VNCYTAKLINFDCVTQFPLLFILLKLITVQQHIKTAVKNQLLSSIAVFLVKKFNFINENKIKNNGLE